MAEGKGIVSLSVEEQRQYIGRSGKIATGVSTITIPVIVRDVRLMFGRLDLLVTPESGTGSAWIDLNRVTLED